MTKQINELQEEDIKYSMRQENVGPVEQGQTDIEADKRYESLEIIDAHIHICPDELAEKNKEIIRRFSGTDPEYDGSISQLSTMMQKSHVRKAVINNTVLKPELMRKANDYTAKVVSANKEKFIGMAWIVPAYGDSVNEVSRCKNELGFKAVKIHHSHFKVLPSDPRNDKIYEKIVELNLPVLFHCGRNPYTPSNAVQYSLPKEFSQVLQSYPRMKVILGHMAGFKDGGKNSIDLIHESHNAVCDTAVDPATEKIDIESFVRDVGLSKLLFGSDYPIHDASNVIAWLKGNLSPSEFKTICNTNPRNFFSV